MTHPDRGEKPSPHRGGGDRLPVRGLRAKGRATRSSSPVRAIAPEPAPLPPRALSGASPASPAAWTPPRRRLVQARSFAASVGWTLLGTLVPGLGLVRTRWRRVGLTLVGLTVGLGLVVAVAALTARSALVGLATNPVALNILWVTLLAWGVVWVVSLVVTHLTTRPQPPNGWQRVGGAALVGTLSLVVALPTFVGARNVYDTASLISTVFTGSTDPDVLDVPSFGNALDPWANKARLNVLILGGDAGADRTGTRTDTVIVASINTATGDTVLYSLPRQTKKLPFPAGSPLARAFPGGYYNLPGQDEGWQYLNAVYMGVQEYAPAKAALAQAKDPGAKALEIGVGEALGLKIDYYAMVNLEGFVELIDALGGVTVNISVPIPVGGKNPTNIGGSDGFPPDRWLAPGPNQHLNGVDALWFARGRYQTDDYARMARQRCVIQAVSQQVNPTNVLANYEALTKAGSTIVQTDVPNGLLPALIELAGRVRGKALRSIAFHDSVDGFSTANPNWTRVRQRVQESLDPPVATVAPTASAPTAAPSTPPGTTRQPPTASATASATASVTKAPDGTTSVADECAYDPTAWAPETP